MVLALQIWSDFGWRDFGKGGISKKGTGKLLSLISIAGEDERRKNICGCMI